MKRSQLTHLLRNPAAMSRFQLTGRLPNLPSPTSPLIDLLERIPPAYRLAIRGVTVGPRLGYEGRRTFATAAHALEWCKPASQPLHVVAEGWRNKRFAGPLHLEDLLAHSSSYPGGTLEHLHHLRAPAAAEPPADWPEPTAP